MYGIEKEACDEGTYHKFYWRVYVDWLVHELANNGFLVMAYNATFVCQKDIDYSLNTSSENNTNIAIIAKRAGVHSEGFVPNFAENVCSSEYPKRNLSYRNVQAPVDRLLLEGSKSFVRMTEINVALQKMLTTLYCPKNGTVLDSFLAS